MTTEHGSGESKRREQPTQQQLTQVGKEEEMTNREFLSVIRSRYERGELSDEDYVAIRNELKAQEPLQRYFQLVEKVAEQIVAKEDSEGFEHQQTRRTTPGPTEQNGC